MKQDLIFVLEDEEDILELIKVNLEQAGFLVEDFTHIAELKAFLSRRNPSLIIMDLMLPDGDGLQLCRELKEDSKTKDIGIIILTARAHESDKIIGLEFGADDYITKPFSPRELIARVKAVLRRTVGQSQQDSAGARSLGPVQIDERKLEVRLEGKLLDLTKTEFNILSLLTSKPGWVYPRDQILDHLWGHDKPVIDRTVDVHISHLREKMGKYGSCIQNIRGVGYKFNPPDASR